MLDSPAKKLFFARFHLKVYPTFDVLGALFAKPRGHSCEDIHRFLPLLDKTLGRKCELPQRRSSSMEEFRQRFPAVQNVMIDGVERPIQRPRSAKRQNRYYSGKKKSHRCKNLVMADARRRVLVLTPSKPGGRHDKNLVDRNHLIAVIPPEMGVVEHAIGGIKRDGAMSQVLRNKLGCFDDRVAVVSAGLWNHHLSSKACNPS